MNDGASGSAVRAAVDSYDVADVLPGVEAIPAGTNLLIRAPAMSGRRELALDLLAAGGPEDHAVAVTTDRPGPDIVRAYEERAPPGSRICAVDCTGRGTDQENVEAVSSPADLTGIGIGVVKCTRALGAADVAGVRLATMSVSTILQYAEPDRVFNFLHVLTGRFSEADYFSVYTLDPGAHDAQTVNAIRSPFDAELEIRETEVGRELRVRGLDGAPAGWIEWTG